MLVRVSKLMSERGLCSRREADHYIEKGWVLVNGERISTLGLKVEETAHIELDKTAQKAQKSKVTILLNKPLGFVSTHAEKGYPSALDLLTQENCIRRKEILPGQFKGLAVAGRLDINSKGLLILSQDGALVKRLIGENCGMEKEYLVSVEGHITKEVIEKLRFGLMLDGKVLKKAKIEQLDEGFLRFTLIEGKKRQIRRMCELVGLEVRKLKRVRVGRVCLGNLPEGKWRFLEKGERF